MFIGDSFTWGYDAEATNRFTELLRPKLPGIRLVNAGVPGYGTDQEYLLLNNVWKTFEPNVVVLILCVDNDRRNNSSNVRYDGYYKPYLKQMPDGSWQFGGRPVPKSRYVYFINNWLVHNLWLARVAVSAYVELSHPQITLPDPTERLIGMMRKFVEAPGAKLLNGLQYLEPQLEAYLQRQKIPYTSFDGAKSYSTDGNHWTPEGHVLVANKLMPLLLQSGIVDAQPGR